MSSDCLNPAAKLLTSAITTSTSVSNESADLTNANFYNSVIKNTDFTGAKLERVNWENSKKLNILEDSK
ncbi:MAG: pentapeptide repeat-containing protein [Ignavibacteriae bacterium]|jgi:uncharacterized protein YjbI with pentapeptide repeats|nr:pentapeptide repeat-containing protein [Ignavibacteriota bacterium]